MGHLFVDVEIMRGLDGPSQTVNVRVDTGSTDSAFPRSLLRRLGMRPVGRDWYELADGTEVRRQYGIAFLRLQEEVGATRVILAGPNDASVLGVTALEQLGLELDPKHGRLRKYRRLMISTRRARMASA